jgi:hypothetical protein
VLNPGPPTQLIGHPGLAGALRPVEHHDRGSAPHSPSVPHRRITPVPGGAR